MIQEKPKKQLNPGLKLALELGPLIVFFFVNSRGKQLSETFPALAQIGDPIFIATAVFMLATAIALMISWFMARTVPLMLLVSSIIILAFGGLTIYLHDEIFIKLKPTIINAIFGSLILGGLLLGRLPLKHIFSVAFEIDDDGWRKLSLRWGIYFFVMALVNEIVWRNFSTDFWVAFKLWGNLPLGIIFTMAQFPLLKRHALPEPDDGAETQ